MSEKSSFFTKEELIEDIKNNLSQYDMADKYGCSQPTVSNYIKKWGLGATAETVTPRDPRIERPSFSYEETKEVLLDKEEETAETVGYYEVDIEIDTELPLRILPMADWHIGSRHTASKRLFECTDKIIEDPQTYTTLNGDLIDNYNTSSYKQGQIEQEIKIQEQKIHAESIIKELAPSTLSILNGCFLKGTPIVANDYTMKPIELIKNVLGSDKGYNVKKQWQNNFHKGKICRISYMGNTVYDIPATDNHPFIGLKREDLQCPYREKGRFCKGINMGKFCEKRCRNKPEIKPKTIKAGDLEVGDFVYISKPKDPNGNKFSIEDMKVFGWYLAEGSVMPEYSRTIFTFGVKDRKYAEEIRDIIKENYNTTSVKLKERKEKNTLPLIVQGKEFSNWIYKYCGRYSHSKKLHIDIINESNKKLKTLINCFRLGDGHTRDDSGKDVTLTTISEDLAWQLWNILLRIGQFASIRQQTRKKRGNGFPRFIFKGYWNDFQINYRPERKRFRFCETEKGYFLPIKKIEKEEYEGIVKNLWIDSDEHLYRANGCLQKNCHDEWSYYNDGFDFARYLSQHSKGYYMGHNGVINLKVGEITYRIYVTHNTHYNSSLNLGHGLGKSWKNIAEFDIGIAAHKHVPHFEQRVMRDQLVTLVHCGAFKGQDRNASKGEYGLPYQTTPAIVLYPHEKKVLGSINWKETERYM